MHFDPAHLIDVPAISTKLKFTMKSGASYEGTGFCVEHQGSAWLITCRHNVEDRVSDFIGTNDLSDMTLMGEGKLDFDEERRVVGICVDGFIPDCAAIELRQGEWQTAPKFDTSIQIAVEGVDLPEIINLQAPSPATHVAQLRPTAWVIFQGFPSGVASPVTLNGVRAVALPKIIQPWMPTFLPACAPGFSGGPVMNITNTSMSLLGITTHRYEAQFAVNMDDGRRAEISILASAAVPLAPLLWALERAPKGNSIIQVRSPQVGDFRFDGCAVVAAGGDAQ